MSSAELTLADVDVVDNHCHAVEADQQGELPGWRGYFSESPYPALRQDGSADTVAYRRLIAWMAQFHGVANDESAVLRARAAIEPGALAGALFRDAGIGTVLVDIGYPAPDKAMDATAFRQATGVGYRTLLRLEVLFESLLADCGSYDELCDAVHDALGDLRAAGHIGLKTVVGYRTGLDIRRWDRADVLDSFAQARTELDHAGRVRLAHQPLLDSLLHLAFAHAAEQELPVQFHVGYGDPDVDLRTAGPLQLRAILEDDAYRAMPIVLLHGCWPYFREGAYLASVYDNAYLDISYAIPFLSTAELTAVTRAAFGTAPIGKLLYSSDGARVPELHWVGARIGRQAVGRVLTELVADGDLDPAAAEDAGRRFLRDNAVELYGLGS